MQSAAGASQDVLDQQLRESQMRLARVLIDTGRLLGMDALTPSQKDELQAVRASFGSAELDRGTHIETQLQQPEIKEQQCEQQQQRQQGLQSSQSQQQPQHQSERMARQPRGHLRHNMRPSSSPVRTAGHSSSTAVSPGNSKIVCADIILLTQRQRTSVYTEWDGRQIQTIRRVSSAPLRPTKFNAQVRLYGSRQPRQSHNAHTAYAESYAKAHADQQWHTSTGGLKKSMKSGYATQPLLTPAAFAAAGGMAALPRTQEPLTVTVDPTMAMPVSLQLLETPIATSPAKPKAP